jgi:hypothetical protein
MQLGAVIVSVLMPPLTLLRLPAQVSVVTPVRRPDVELVAAVPLPPTLAGKVPDPPAPKKGSPVSSSPSPCPPCSTSSPTTARRAGRRQPQSRRSPRAFRSNWHGSQEHWAAGVESQLGHCPPRPNVVVGHTRAICASEPAARTGRCSEQCWAASRIRPIGRCFVFLFPEWIQNLANFKKLCKFGLNVEKCETNFLG